jgi:hypothetical protein
MTTIIQTSTELKSQLKSSLRTRGIKYSDKRDTIMVNFGVTASVCLWKPKTITAYMTYIDTMFDKIRMALSEEAKAKAKEDARVVAVMEKILTDLGTLNSYLFLMGEPLQPSIKKARAHFKSHVFIGIYDFVDEKFNRRHDTLADLANYINMKSGNYYPNRFPRKAAKKSLILRAFLQRIY